MRFKVEEDCIFFDQHKNIISDFPSKIFGLFIIQLSGFMGYGSEIMVQLEYITSKITSTR